MTTRFESWARVSMMGHRTHYGEVVEITLADVAMLQVRVPAIPGRRDEVTHIIPPAALYELTLMSQEQVMAILRHQPIEPMYADDDIDDADPGDDDDDDDVDDEDDVKDGLIEFQPISREDRRRMLDGRWTTSNVTLEGVTSGYPVSIPPDVLATANWHEITLAPEAEDVLSGGAGEGADDGA